jgi:catechol-2,3-dioxygenase
MALVHGHGFVTLGVPDLSSAVDFYTNTCRFVVTERRTTEVFLTGDERHHWLRLQERESPGLIRLGYKAVDAAAIGEVARRLERAGVPFTDGGLIGEDRVHGGIRFRDPSGIEIELYEEMVELAQSPAPLEAGFMLLLHAVVHCADVAAGEAFYTQNLEFRRSDQIEDLAVFLRAENCYHHSLALMRSTSPGKLDHFAILLKDIDHVMRFQAHATAQGVLETGAVRHAASGSVSIYLRDESTDVGIEFCTSHMQIDDDSYRGRLLKADPATANVWSRTFS